MKKVNWTLPFKDLRYLDSLTEELSNFEAIKLITAVQNPFGMVESCRISIKENDNMDETLLLIGATIGAHSAVYAMEMVEMQEEFMRSLIDMCENCEEDCEEREQTEDKDIEEDKDLFEEETEELEVETPLDEEEIEEEEEENVVEEEIEDEKEVTEKEIKAVIKKTPDSPAKALLRRILINFKKVTMLF